MGHRLDGAMVGGQGCVARLSAVKYIVTLRNYRVRKDTVEDTLNLTPLEQEITTLKAVLDMIGDMVNHETMTIHFTDPDSSVMFKTMTHMAFFNIILVDLLSKPIEFFVGGESYIDRLKRICANPRMGEIQDVGELGEAVCAFDSWLSEKVEVKNCWFPSLELQIDISIERQLFISICGNITKHNFTQLTRQAKRLSRVFCENGKSVSLDKCILALQDFREQFYNDIFHYHSSTIAEFLNNIRWGIYLYAAPVRAHCVEDHYDEELRLNAYTYAYPRDVTSALGKTCYWNLMNDVMRQPYIQRFEVTKYLKMKY